MGKQIRLEGPYGALAVFDMDDLASFGGNLYIHVDGDEWGSLWFTGFGAEYDEFGSPRIELGQFDHGTEMWETRNPLTTTVRATGGEA